MKRTKKTLDTMIILHKRNQNLAREMEKRTERMYDAEDYAHVLERELKELQAVVAYQTSLLNKRLKKQLTPKTK